MLLLDQALTRTKVGGGICFLPQVFIILFHPLQIKSSKFLSLIFYIWCREINESIGKKKSG